MLDDNVKGKLAASEDNNAKSASEDNAQTLAKEKGIKAAEP